MRISDWSSDVCSSDLDPRSPAEARFSMQFAVAMTLCDPDWGLSALDPQRLADPALRDLMHRVSMVTGPSWQAPERSTNAPEGASVRLDLHDGRDRKSVV